MLYNPLLEPINTVVTIRTPCLSTPPYTPHDSKLSLNTLILTPLLAPPENSNITNVSKTSRKMFTIYVSVHNTQPLLQLKSVGKKCGLYTVKDGYIQFSLHLVLPKKSEIKVNLLNEYNSADIILLFRHIILYIILCENTGQQENNSNLGNYGLNRKFIAIHQRNIIKHRFFIYLVKYIIHV